MSDDSNRAYYGKDASPLDIIVKKTVTNPYSNNLRAEAKKDMQQGMKQAAR